MTVNKRSVFGWVLGALALTAGTAQAESPAEPTVTGTGAATIKRAPDVMRVQVMLQGEGKTLKDALAQLKARQESARKKLATLGAAEASVAFEDPRVAGGPGDQRAQMEQIMRSRMRGGGGAARPATNPAAAPPQRVMTVLKADWPITAATPEERLIAGQELQDKIKKADLGEAKVASLEEQERREELAAMNGGDEAGAAPGEPSFSYVCKIPADERVKATAEAFKKAKAQAGEIARAAAAELGDVRQLSSQSASDAEQMMEYRRYRAMGMTPPASADEDEATGTDPAGVTVRVSVTAVFGIKGK